MRQLKDEMRRLEGQGLSRKKIGLILGCTPAQVTNGLGPVRVWRDRRTNVECSTRNIKVKSFSAEPQEIDEEIVQLP